MSKVTEAFEKLYGRARLRALDAMTKPKRRRAVFLHIPKTAGSSVNYYFKSNFGSGSSPRIIMLNDILDPVDSVRFSGNESFIGGHFGWESYQHFCSENDFTFTFLRDPFERLYSNYAHWSDASRLGNKIAEDAGVKVIQKMTFAEFCLSEDSEVLKYSDNLMVRQIAKTTKFIPSDQIESLVSTAKTNIERLSYVAFLDTIDSDILEIAEQLQLPPPKLSPRKNVNLKPKEDISPEVLSLAEPRIRLDRELYCFARQTLLR